MYDPVIGRFITTDPMNEFYSPYVGMGNNPVGLTDPTGGSTNNPIVGEDGTYLGNDSEGWKGEVIVMKEETYKDLSNNGKNVIDHEAAKDWGTMLTSWGQGISIKDETWDLIASNGGQVFIPTVINNYTSTVGAKPEESYLDNEVYEIAPHTELYAPIDGINVNGAIYKTSNEVFQTIITKDVFGTGETVSRQFRNNNDFRNSRCKNMDPRIYYRNDWKALRNFKP